MEGTSKNTTPDHETTSSIFTNEWFLIEILCRMPVKPVFRFNCVSKQCLKLISEPSFVRTYTSRALSSSKPLPWTLVTRSICIHQAAYPYEERFDFDRNLDSSLLMNSYESPTISRLVTPLQMFRPVAISNGLILCRWDFKPFAIYNPVTKQYIVLPGPHSLQGDSMAFHAHVDHQSGVVSYKVARLRMVWDAPTTDHRVEELSSATNVWTSVSVCFPEPILSSNFSAYFSFKGIFHWFDESSSADGLSRCVITYDPVRIIRTPGSGSIIWCGEIVGAGGEVGNILSVASNVIMNTFSVCGE